MAKVLPLSWHRRVRTVHIHTVPAVEPLSLSFYQFIYQLDSNNDGFGDHSAKVLVHVHHPGILHSRLTQLYAYCGVPLCRISSSRG